MKRIVILAALSFLALLGVSRLIAQPADADAKDKPEKTAERAFREVPVLGISVPGKVLSVHDGDTLKVECRVVMDIRLLDCWAPELKGESKEAGIRSREHLKRLADGKPCIVHVPWNAENIGKMTTLGRVLGKVYVNGDDLSYEQVRKKMATKTKESMP